MAIDTISYGALKPAKISYIATLLLLILLIALGGYSALVMEHHGHHITGMNNHVVWGLPHVFAILLIVTASGALNAASFASVFGASQYKPYARLSVVLAIALLIGGLLVLVLDLGRPDRLIIAMTTYNFSSIFTWNIFLYTGFVGLGVVYLWVMMEPKLNKYTTQIGAFVYVWRVVLTTGTGSIFGFLVGRNALDTALLAPMFIALSLVLGLAVFALLLVAIAHWRGDVLPEILVASMSKLLLWFLLGVAYFSIVHHVTNLYVMEHQAVEQFSLKGPLSPVFWLGYIVIGTVLPVFLLLTANADNKGQRLLWASFFAIVGGCTLIYNILIGAQSTPQRLFPDKTVIDSRFGDAGFALYQPSGWEFSLGIGGFAMAILLFLVLLRILPFIPLQKTR